MIKLNNITKDYPIGHRQLSVLKGISLHIKSGETVAVMGPSGSGKSTLLNLLGCLDRPTAGEYYLDGREVSQLTSRELSAVRANKIGFVFQSYNLLPKMSALANVELGMKYCGYVDRDAALAALDRVGLSERAHHKPNEMSGGEQQRVALARALVKNPPIIFADEPTGNLDTKSSNEIMSIIISLQQERNVTLVMITHEPEIAEYCERIIHIRDGQIVDEEIK